MYWQDKKIKVIGITFLASVSVCILMWISTSLFFDPWRSVSVGSVWIVYIITYLSLFTGLVSFLLLVFLLIYKMVRRKSE
jgi:hypothetical protein